MKNESKSQGSGTNGQGAGSKASADGALTGMSLEFHNFLADIEDLIKTTTSLTGEDLARAKAKLSERVTAAKESVEELSGVIADGARTSVAVTDAYVHDQPWKAIGIGAALGFVVGFALARRV